MGAGAGSELFVAHVEKVCGEGPDNSNEEKQIHGQFVGCFAEVSGSVA